MCGLSRDTLACGSRAARNTQAARRPASRPLPPVRRAHLPPRSKPQEHTLPSASRARPRMPGPSRTDLLGCRRQCCAQLAASPPDTPTQTTVHWASQSADPFLASPLLTGQAAVQFDLASALTKKEGRLIRKAEYMIPYHMARCPNYGWKDSEEYARAEELKVKISKIEEKAKKRWEANFC